MIFAHRLPYRGLWTLRRLCLCRRTFSVSIPGALHDESNCSLLVRDFISSSLYSPKGGYFNSGQRIHSPLRPLNFRNMKGLTDYEYALAQLYRSHMESWMTPVELFQPVYAEAVLNWILSHHQPQSERLQILEIGPGCGTCALNILDRLRVDRPELYGNTIYSLLDISLQYSTLQKDRLHKSDHAKATRFLQCSANDLPRLEEYNPEVPTFVIGLEVLDNFPHDKIVFTEDNDVPQQVEVRFGDKGKLEEVAVDISDPLLSSFLEIEKQIEGPAFRDPSLPMSSAVGKIFQAIQFGWTRGSSGKATREVFVPTVCLSFLRKLAQRLPNHHIFLADFDELTGTIAGENSPVVSEKSLSSGGETIDHDTYLAAKGTVDIFFPTDFERLRKMYELVCARTGTVDSTRVVMEKYADTSQCETKDGYNPLLEDYSNTKILLS